MNTTIIADLMRQNEQLKQELAHRDAQIARVEQLIDGYCRADEAVHDGKGVYRNVANGVWKALRGLPL